MSGKVLLRIGVILLVIGLAVWFIMGSTKAREYEQISDSLCRATVTSVEEFTGAEAKAHPRTVVMLIPRGADRTEPWATMVQYCFRGHIRVTTLEVPPEGPLTYAQIAKILGEIQSFTHLPILVIGPDSARVGQVTAAYRLAVERLPLASVQRLAQLPDASPETVRQVREFAQVYDQALREAEQKAPATAPSATTQPAAPAANTR